jgi:hypothetical protein
MPTLKNSREMDAWPSTSQRPGPDTVPFTVSDARLMLLYLTAAPTRKSISKWKTGSKMNRASKPRNASTRKPPPAATRLASAPVWKLFEVMAT